MQSWIRFSVVWFISGFKALYFWYPTKKVATAIFPSVIAPVLLVTTSISSPLFSSALTEFTFICSSSILSFENAIESLTSLRIALGSVIKIRAVPICRCSKNREKESQVKKLLCDENKLSSTQSAIKARKPAKAPLKPHFSIKSPSWTSCSSIGVF